MNIASLISTLNAALKNNALSLTDPIAGLSWTSDLKTAIATQLQISSLHLGATDLKAVAAPAGSVSDSKGADLPSVLLFGVPDSDVLAFPKAQTEITLYVTPVNLSDDSNTQVDFTLILQNKVTAIWTPSDSFPGLASSFVFSHLATTHAPSLLLTSLAHAQQWNLGGPGTGFSNNFPNLTPGLNLQVPAGLSTDIFPVLENLFGDLSTGTFYFNGPVDNSKTGTDSANISMKLLTDLGDNHNAVIQGNEAITFEFDAGFEAIPATSSPSDASQSATVLSSNLLLQTTIGNALIQALIPLDGNSLLFSMSGLDDQPALSLADVKALFQQSVLQSNLPDKIQQSDFFSHIGIENIAVGLNIPQGGKPELSSILLKLGYANGPAIGYVPWFALNAFSVSWSVDNPTFPLSNSNMEILLAGDLEFLKGDVAFEANFTNDPTIGKWVFALNGGLVEGSSIQLSDLFSQFSSDAADFPVISIDELAFSATPDKSLYSGSIELDIDWSFTNFSLPKISSLKADLDKNGEEITGSIAAQIVIGTGDDAPAFDLSAARSDTDWTFSAQSDHPFAIGDLATAFGFQHPDYLDEIQIAQCSLKYIAPIKTASQPLPKPADAPLDSTFELVIEAKFPIAGELLDVTITYHIDKDGWELKGVFLIGPAGAPEKALEFDFDAKSGGDPNTKETTLIAKLNASGKPLNISDFAAAFNAPAPPIPDALNDLEISDASFEYDTGTAGKGLLLNVTSDHYGEIVFAIVKTGSDTQPVWKPFFAVAFKPTLDFDKLPVVGDYIAKVANPLTINQIQVAGVPKAMSVEDLTELNTLFTNASAPTTLIPKVPDGQGLPAEAIFNAVFQINEDKKPINLILSGKGISTGGSSNAEAAQPGPSAAPGDDSDSSLPTNNTKQKVGKSFGPVTLTGFNIGFSDGKITLDVSGELSLGGIAMSFQGLGIGMKFPPQSFTDVSFRLHGLGVNMNKGGMRIAGGFVTMDDNYDNFMGMLIITAGSIGIQAYGGYATTTPQPSFFIFLNVEVPLGGPPFFFIDGVAGGFGINRQFIMPDFEDLPTFPLLPGASSNPLPTGAPASVDDITQVLTQLAKFIPPKAGAYWIAAGLDFTSFELLQVTAILEMSFGAGFQIGLIGSAALSVPEPEEPIAFVQLDFEINFDSEAGFFAVLAVLTPASYVFSGACHLQGGFAFYTWYKDQLNGASAGDFLITLGGYHPAFHKPAWYPAVPRLGMNWNLGVLKISGQAYFALTPHMIMAGLEMSAVFDIKIVKATFDAGFDFLLGWKPFFYLADAYIHIDIELHLLFTIHFHVGVDMNIWGPEFGGTARIDLSIFSFTISFGSSAPTPPPISWVDFKKLLPNSQPSEQAAPQLMRGNELLFAAAADVPPFSVSQVDIESGMLQTLSDKPLKQADLNNEKVFNWLIDPNDFAFLLLAGVPCNNFWFNYSDPVGSGDLPNSPTDSFNARAQPAQFTPSPGAKSIYKSTNDPKAFYSRDPDGSTKSDVIFAYDVPSDLATAWWKCKVQVGPVDIEEGIFNTDGSLISGFESTFIVKIYKLEENNTRSYESNFVVTLLNRNAAKSLWGSLVNPSNGSAVLNDEVLLKDALFGINLTPKIWNPLKTRDINIYLLLFDGANNLCWPVEATPETGANTFEEQISSDGNSMQFNMPGGGVVQSTFRQLNANAFGNAAAGAALVNNLNNLFGYNFEVSQDSKALAAPMYKDWPALMLTGEE